MAQGGFKVCPNCGTRNKVGWEFCARCGEDIHAVAAGTAATPRPAAVASDEPTPASSSWLGLVGVVVVLAVAGYAGARLRHVDPGRRPDPGLFALPPVPASRPPARPDPSTEAERAFEEGRRLLTRGDYAGAASALARAIGEAPDNGYYRNMYARALLGSGAPAAEIIRQFEEAIRLEPGSASNVTDLARAYAKLGRGDDALKAYARALEMSPGDKDALREISATYTRSGRPEAALPYLKQLSATSPDDLVVQQDLGLAYDKAGDKAAAEQTYRDIVARFPQAAVTRGLLAEILLQGGKTDEAVALLRSGVEGDPAAPLLHRTLASALERSGQMAEAAREYREYARLNPSAADAQAMADRAARLEARVAQSS
jgi:predicted Zn-dependent protease